jgi:D-galactarolactone cycloisomerase
MAPQLKIERIECVPLSMPLPRTFRGSNYFMTHRCTIITRVYPSAGIVGEIYNGDEFETQGEVVKIILDEIQPLLIGKDAFNTEGCWELMRRPSTNILRDRKLAMCAQACVDSALWDAVGKALDAPLYKLWGRYADRLPSISSPATTRKARRSPTSAARWSRSSSRVMQAASSRSAAGLRLKTPNAYGLRAKR